MAALENSKQELFALAIVRGESEADAYEGAGYRRSEPNASRMRKNDRVAARIEELKAKALKRNDITVDRLLEEWRRLAFFDLRKAFDAEGNMLAVHNLPDEIGAALTEFNDKDKRLSGKGKADALKFLSKYMGMDGDGLQTEESMAERIKRLRDQRANASGRSDSE